MGARFRVLRGGLGKRRAAFRQSGSRGLCAASHCERGKNTRRRSRAAGASGDAATRRSAAGALGLPTLDFRLLIGRAIGRNARRCRNTGERIVRRRHLRRFHEADGQTSTNWGPMALQLARSSGSSAAYAESVLAAKYVFSGDLTTARNYLESAVPALQQSGPRSRRGIYMR